MTNSKIEIEIVGPALAFDHMTPSRYRRECDRLERWYSALEINTPYRVTVRPAYKGEACGTYERRANGNLQILGYSVEKPEDLCNLSQRAWDGYASGKRAPAPPHCAFF